MTTEELFKIEHRKQTLLYEQLIEKEQNACSHLAGGLSKHAMPDAEYGYTCIVWHKLNNGVWVGICQECFRKFRPEDSDYTYWFIRQSFSTRSEAGYEAPVEKTDDVKKEINSQFNAFNPRFYDGTVLDTPDLIVDSDSIRVKVSYPIEQKLVF
jgi:hypothetical protein